MKQLKGLAALLFLLMMTVSVTSCEKDEPGSQSSHDYYTAEVSGDPSYYWVIDMSHDSGPGYDGTFVIQAWSLDGKKLGNKSSYSGKYQTKDSRIYITWNHQSMNTMWEFSTSGSIRMIGSANPEELAYLTFYYGAPDFE